MSDKFTNLHKRIALLLESRDIEKALQVARNYCKKNDKDIRGFILQGSVLGQNGRYPQARDAYLRATTLGPGNVTAWFGVAKSNLMMGRYSEAINGYHKVISLVPSDAEAWFDMGNALRIIGDRTAAVESLQQAIKCQPNYPAAYFSLSGLKKYVANDLDMPVMEAMLEEGLQSNGSAVFLHFALAKAYEDCGQYDRAFAHLERGNSLKRSTYHYDIFSHEQDFAAIKRIFSRELFARIGAVGIEDSSPIFVVGMPRSGTTLVEQILSAHPAVHGAGELPDLSRIVFGACSDREDGNFPRSVSSLKADDFRDMALRYIESIRAIATQDHYIVDKNPANFLLLGMLRLMLPNAHVIHCQRDPLDTCLSIYQQNFSSPRSYAYDLNEIGRYYRLYTDLMQHWRDVLPGFVHDVSYEGLIEDQAVVTRGLLGYCGLDWNDDCLNFFGSTRAVVTASIEQVRRPIYRSSVLKWQHYRNHLEPLMDALGVNDE